MQTTRPRLAKAVLCGLPTALLTGGATSSAQESPLRNIAAVASPDRGRPRLVR